jgi:IclR family KDG regulon transcriptional repressor
MRNKDDRRLNFMTNLKTKEEPKRDYLLSSVKNALKILRSFSMDEPEKKISELAVSLNLSKSTVSRLMSTLASEGFVAKDPETQRYRLGLSVLALGGIINSNLDYYKETLPILRRLMNDIGETAHLAVLEKNEVIYLYKVECNHPVRIFTHIGRQNPIHCTSSGKVILAFHDEATIEKVIENGLHRYTENTITDPKEFRNKLQLIRKQGYSTSFGELLDGVVSIAVPVRDYTGQVVSAVNIVGPSQRIKSHKISFYAKKIKSAAEEISEILGYYN